MSDKTDHSICALAIAEERARADRLEAARAALVEAITAENYCRLCDGWDQRVANVIEHKSRCALAAQPAAAGTGEGER